jgi:D-alanine-D-alanine ligase
MKTSFQSPLDLNECGTPVELHRHAGHCQLKKVGSSEIHTLDLAFPIIHGPFGEDGELQKRLAELGLAYVGTGVQGCMNSFDKGLTKEILGQSSIPQVPYLSFQGEALSWPEVTRQLGTPLFIKPANMGSSIGISKVKTETDYLPALKAAREHDSKILIEKGIRARELECALLETDQGLKVTGLGEVIPRHEFYSYEAKYLDDKGADIVIPAKVDQKVIQSVQALAKQAFVALDCQDYARADFFMDETGAIYFNEINTHPGFTNISQFPMLWKQEGMSYPDLITHLLQRALRRAQTSGSR